jgi:hypothetical protein
MIGIPTIKYRTIIINKVKKKKIPNDREKYFLTTGGGQPYGVCIIIFISLLNKIHKKN